MGPLRAERRLIVDCWAWVHGSDWQPRRVPDEEPGMVATFGGGVGGKERGDYGQLSRGALPGAGEGWFWKGVWAQGKGFKPGR